MDELKSITNLVQKWELNKALLARKMNMLPATFNNKFNPKYTHINFTPEELGKLKSILVKLREDLKAL
jgi:hypothetical protein